MAQTTTTTTTRETKEEMFSRVRARIAERRVKAEANKDPNVLRSPVICVLGHVDTGKTKMLDTVSSPSISPSPPIISHLLSIRFAAHTYKMEKPAV
jgi:hypothetical protein